MIEKYNMETNSVSNDISIFVKTNTLKGKRKPSKSIILD